jgi:hypothetical protein
LGFYVWVVDVQVRFDKSGWDFVPEAVEDVARDVVCYGRLAVVSDVDDGGFALNVDKELRGSAVL